MSSMDLPCCFYKVPYFSSLYLVMILILNFHQMYLLIFPDLQGITVPLPFSLGCTWDEWLTQIVFIHGYFRQAHSLPFYKVSLTFSPLFYTLYFLISSNQKPPIAESAGQRPLWHCWRSHSFALARQINTVTRFQARNTQQENKSSVSPEHWLTEKANSQRSTGSHATPTLTPYCLLCVTEDVREQWTVMKSRPRTASLISQV